MRLYDLHCDTLFEAEKNKQSFEDGLLHVNIKRASQLNEYKQVPAIWNSIELTSDQAYASFWRILEYYMDNKPSRDIFTDFISVENASLLGNDIKRLDEIYNAGVRIITPVWGGVNSIGGAHDTTVGLTDFGKEVIERCCEIGVIPDISHSSDITANEILDISSKYSRPVIATHSCSRAICDIKRNLSDELAKRIYQSGGIIGVNFVTSHIGSKSPYDIMKHIDHYIELTDEDHVCLGADFDGTNELPDNVNSLADISVVYEIMQKNRYSEALIDKIFYIVITLMPLNES